MEHPLIAKNGTEIPVTISGMPTLWEGEAASIAFVRDLTEKHSLEMQLMTTDRLASLGRLAAGVGHEINNPLTYVLGNVRAAAMRIRAMPDAPADVGEMLDDALEGAERVRRIVQDLRVFTRRAADDAVSCDLHAVVESCLRMAGAEVRPRARVVKDFSRDVPLVRASEARLAQVVLNLVLNAAQAIPDSLGGAEGHAITLTTRVEPDGRVALRVADTGVGIPPADLAQVFEPFFTTKGDRGGTGLGLSICQMLVTAHGGEIAISSEPGRGTTVSVLLRAARRPGAHDRSASPRSSTRNGTRRVLVVDDEVHIAELLRDGLSEHEVALATNGPDAIARLSSGARYDVIICDLMMPGMSGMEVHEQARRIEPGLERSIIFITGGAYTAGASQFLASVGNACLEKPFAMADLVAAIERTAATCRAG
jgi:signal transduction histidine kinase/ActR/RegA family two-component response regulator